MIARFGCCTSRIIVAAVTIAGTAGIMGPATAQEGSGGMTYMAIQRSYQVWRTGFGALANSRHTIMTGRTVIHNAGMIKYRTEEIGSVMTDTAILIG